jgi:ribonuclease P protein component
VPKHKHTSVERNRLKRRLRELVRTELLPALRSGSPVDVVVRAGSDAYDASFEELRVASKRFVGKLHHGDSTRG